MTDKWLPFGLDDEEANEFHVLVDGVPPWMREPLVNWCGGQAMSDPWAHPGRWLAAQTATRVSLGLEAGMDSSSLHRNNLVDRLRTLPDIKLLRITDYWLRQAGPIRSPENLRLAAVLSDCGSKWMVGDRDGATGLVERVPEGVQIAVEQAIDVSGTAGKVLARAWAQVHGLEPNDSGAYSDAVRAVEIAASKVVAPDDATATLGKRLGQMKSDADWGLDFREHPDAPSSQMLLMMLRTLWFGHRDRHGSADYTDVSHEEAAQAVYLAATLVAWFDSGAIKRR